MLSQQYGHFEANTYIEFAIEYIICDILLYFVNEFLSFQNIMFR